MRCLESMKKMFLYLKEIFGPENDELQPRDILMKLFQEMEKRKKFGIEEKAYIPNVYTIYLNSFDFEEISPLISEIKEQLKNKLVDKVKKKGYKILSASLVLEIRDDAGLSKNQVLIESSFMKEKSFSGSSVNRNVSLDNQEQLPKVGGKINDILSGAGYNMKITQPIAEQTKKPDEHKTGDVKSFENQSQFNLHNSGGTKIIEDKKTKIIDISRVKLEIIKGQGQGGVIALKDGEHTFGRGQEAEYLLEDQEDTVSRLHFKLIVRDDRIRIKDLESLNGTSVNDIEIEETELQKGDIISAGKLLLKVV